MNSSEDFIKLPPRPTDYKRTLLDIAYDEFVRRVNDAYRKGRNYIYTPSRQRSDKIEFTLDFQSLTHLYMICIKGTWYRLDRELKSECLLGIDGYLGPERIADANRRLEIVNRREDKDTQRDDVFAKWGEYGKAVWAVCKPTDKSRELRNLRDCARIRDAVIEVLDYITDGGECPKSMREARRIGLALAHISAKPRCDSRDINKPEDQRRYYPSDFEQVQKMVQAIAAWKQRQDAKQQKA